MYTFKGQERKQTTATNFGFWKTNKQVIKC